MKFGIIENGQVIEAPQEYKHIKDFQGYLELMYNHSFLDRMYGYKPIEELTKVTNEEKIKKLEEENERLKFEQQSQDSFIEVTMMATDEIYMMIEPLLDSMKQQSINILSENLEKEVNKMVDFYAAMVIKGLKNVDEVPLRYREDVKKLLAELEK